MDYENPWTISDEPVTDDMVDGYAAFVYIITNHTNNKQYVGKKRLQFIKTRSVKKKKKRVKVPSDWKDYWGSNAELLEDIKNGHECSRRIIRLCKTLGESTYYEARTQFDLDVLLYPDRYYNSWIMCKVRRSHLPKTS